MNNVINNASWKITDILLATPIVMCHILENKEKFDPYDINPEVIIIDEYDELLQNAGVSQFVNKILKKFATFQKDKNNPLAEVNVKR
jgi:superfamily II DNA/RNA helicase